ncbi:MAG: 1-deoxy-D-xylulose-5-phosphate synthase [Dermatophilaceae bacterium]
MSLLETIRTPADLARLDPAVLPTLAVEIRAFLVHSVSKTGGHLGPNLGVVELTIALHRVFDSPRDTIVFDTGHIAYVHKLLTGRQEFDKLRAKGGLSGYPSRAESEHDVVENSHASASLSWAEGIARAYQLRGQRRHAVAVIGDGALTGGMAWEALNNLAVAKELPVVIVVNDNTRSYATTIGGLSEHLSWLRTTGSYEALMSWGRERLTRTPIVGGPAFGALHGVKKGIKDILAPQGLFEDLGMKYVGPVDGHDEQAIEVALRQAKGFGAPVIVHVITRKGEGYDPARNDDADQFHAVGVINPETGLPLEVSGRSWTDEFSGAIEPLAARRPDVVALTAAMLIPVGLKGFAAAHPDRVFDVGIAEQHAVTMAAGLAYGGLHPVVCLYSTFLNRAFDQLLMDCALHQAGVTFVLDRAGITGNDGPSHHGMWDMSLANIVPGLRLAAPRDGVRLARSLEQAVDVDDAPTVLRFPKGNPPEPMEPLRSLGCVDVLAERDGGAVDDLIVGIGAMVPTALAVGEGLAADGRSVRVVDPVWALPVPHELVAQARDAARVVVIEDNAVAGGIGAAVALALSQEGVATPVVQEGIPKRFLEHASRAEALADIGLTPESILQSLRGVSAAAAASPPPEMAP